MPVAMGTTEQVLGWLKKLEAEGCETYLDMEAGTAAARDGEAVVFRALQKGYQQPWILQFTDSTKIQWK